MIARTTRTAAAALIAAAVAVAAVQSGAPARQVPGAPGSGVPSGPPVPAGAPPAAGAPIPGPPSAAPSPMLTPPPTPVAAPAVSPAQQRSPGRPAQAPAAAAPAATPPADLIRFAGQLLDVRNGFVYFTTADAFKTSPQLRIENLDRPGVPIEPAPRLYARAVLDPATHEVTELALTHKRIPSDEASLAAYARAHVLAAATSPTVPAPELNGQVRVTGRPVAVTFYVQVPPTTPLSDNVYITTDASGWVANAMRMDRIDALHYRLTRTYASGTKFSYKYTRGSWTSVEVGEDGLEDDARPFFVPEVDAKRTDDKVFRWSDQNPSQPQVGPDSIPTPFNPNPFGNLPSAIQHPGIPPASPTPRP